MRCSMRIGFQGRSKLQTAWANCRLRPSLPASVASSTRAGPRNCVDGRFLGQPRQAAVEDGDLVARLLAAAAAASPGWPGTA